MSAGSPRYDAVVIGGGIQGLTLAEEAGARGKRVLLIEAGQFGRRSTAASLGIVHGGFRYWQELDAARLVRSRREQAWFLQQFPGLIRPLRCIMPFYRHERAKPGLFAVAAIADRAVRAYVPGATRTLPAPRLIGRCALLDEAPWLSAEPVRGAGEWHDVELVDVPGLVQALLARAARRGVTFMDETAVRRVTVAVDGAVTGIDGSCPATGRAVQVEAPVVINCSGTALLEIARSAHPDGPDFFQPLPAYNIRIRHMPALPAAFAVGRGRRLFLRPDPDGVVAGTFYGSDAELNRWMQDLRSAAPGLDFPSEGLDVIAGVVPAGTNGEPAKQDVIVDHGAVGGPRGLFSVSGVKLTTARWLSARAAARIWPTEPRQADRHPSQESS